MMSVLPGPGHISFARGVPAPEMFPTEELAEASHKAFREHSATALNYGSPGGFRPLQEWIGARHGASPERVLITPGSFMLLSLLVRLLVSRSTAVAVEAPTYDRMSALLKRADADVVSIARSARGLDLVALEAQLSGGRRPAFLYLLPTFHNPTGSTLCRQEREQLADLAVRFDLLVVEDDPYGLLRIEGEAQPSIHSLLESRGASDLSVLISSFSKTIAPGLRVGYAILPERLALAMADSVLETYVSPPLWPQAELYEFLRAGHWEPHLHRIRALLRTRRDVLVERFTAGLLGRARWEVPEGGYFLWLELPSAINTQQLLKASAAVGVSFVPGDSFYPGEGGASCARFSYSYPTLDEIRLGADRVVALIRARLDADGPQQVAT